MLEIQRTNLDLQSILQSSIYSSLIKPSLIPNLTHPSSLTRWVTIEAVLDGQLAGLSLSEIFPLNRRAHLASLFVNPAFRRQGIGNKLFSFTEKVLLQEEKIETIELLYNQTDPYSVALEKMIASRGWFPPQMYLIRCYLDAIAFNPSWIHQSRILPPPMSLFLWKDLNIEERNYIEYLTDQGRVLSYLSPLNEEETIDLETSVGLRGENKILGWCLTRRQDPKTIRYSSLYIDRALTAGGYGIQLLIESIRLQKQLGIPFAIFEVNVKEIDPSWRQFIQKRLIPYSNKVERIKRTFRIS